MAEFPVLVEGLPVELGSVKSKLAIYFQSKKKSGGGECEIKAHEDPRKFLVYFKNEQVKENVLKKEFHTVQLMSSETVQLRVIEYESGNRRKRSESPIKFTAISSKMPAIEQSQLLTGSQSHNTHEQSPTKGFQNQESSVPIEESGLDPYNTEDSCLNQLLINSDDPLDTDVVAMYFEKFASDVEIHENGETSWFVTCSSREDLEKIISQKQHKLGGKTLDVQLYDKKKEDDKYEPRTFLLKGFDVNSRVDHISLYVDSLSNNTRHQIEPLQDGENVMVIFETDIDANSFLKNCGQKPFENHCITAQRLAKTNSVQIEGVQPSLSDDYLDLYFSNTNRSGGGDVTEIIVQRLAKKAIIRFQDHEVVRRVLEREHCLKGIQLSVNRYYHDQQLSLCVSNDPKFKLPEQCSICINPILLNYIGKTRCFNQELEIIAKSVYCNITFANSANANEMILKPSFDANILLYYKIAKDWKKQAEEAIRKFIGQFDFRDFPTDKELWEKVKNRSRGLKAPGLDVCYFCAENKVVLVGKKNNTLEASKILEGILEKARKELAIVRNTVEEQVLLQCLEELEFVQSHVKASISSVEISTCKAPPALKLKGLKEDVCQALKIISQFQSQLERKPLHQSSCMMDFIKSLDLKEFVQTQFIQNGIKATLVHGQSVELLAVKADVSKGEDKIKQLLQEIRIDMTPQQIKVTEDDKWERFLNDLEVDTKSNNVGCGIREEKNQGAILIAGYSNIVSGVAKMINNYLDNKKVITKLISATVMQVDYMENCFILSELPEMQSKGIIISYIRKPSPGLKISGAAEHMNEAVSAIEDNLSQIQSTTYTYSKPGEARALSKHKDILKVKAKDHGCMLLIETNEEYRSLTSHPQPIIAQQKQMHIIPTLPPEASTSSPTAILINGITITLKKGDITQESTDAIVNSTNSTLDLDSGVSGAILKAAGSCVQEECKALELQPSTNLVQHLLLALSGNRGKQSSDGVAVTQSGKLHCRLIVHMVGPTTATGITASVHNVLKECEKHNVISVAFPAIGTGKGGISCKTAIHAIFSGLENYFSRISTSSMKSISIVAFEQYVYDTFAEAFEEKSLNSSVNTMDTAQMTTDPQGSVTTQGQRGGLLPTQLKIHNVFVEVKKGDITNESVKAIVNSTNTTLNLNSGVSGAILAKAGSTVVDECKKLGSQPNDGVVVTSGGNLTCDYIIHMVGQTSPALITASVEKVLQECEKHQITTVSFPALGTGVGGMNPRDTLESMLIGFENHLSQNKPSSIKLVYIVVFQPDMYAIFSDVLLKKSQQKFNSVEVTIGKVKLVAVQGDITAEQTDAIVNCTNVNLNRNKGVCGAILKAAGQSVVDECTQLGVQNEDTVVSTKAGNLQVKYIIHLAGWLKAQNTKGSLVKVLKECENLKISSVSFPALGTGEAKLNPQDIASALMDAISDYVVDFVQPSLSLIRIVLFNSFMLDSFRQCIEKRFKHSQSTVRPIDAVRPIYPVTLTATKHLTATVEIYGVKQENIAGTQKDIENIIKENCISKTIPTTVIGCFLDDEKQQIMDLCDKYNLKVEIREKEIVVDGYHADVLESIVQVNSMLQNVTSRELRKQDEIQLKKTVQWEIMTDETAQPYDQSLNYEIERAYLDKKKTIVYMKDGEKYTIDLASLQEKDSKGNVVDIKRSVLQGVFELPPNWSYMKNQEVLIVVLQSGTQEYKDVAKTFKKSCGKTIVDIVKIERVQNLKLWQSYSVRKQNAERKYPGMTIEQILYHGTTKEIAQRVNKTGFNRSFCGRNATYYGRGTYFALDASYSCDNKYSNPDCDGCKCIYQARVITGKLCKGESNMLEPKPVDPQIDSADLCDCAVNDENSPSIFVIFCDDGAYPEYLITFKTRVA
ncbi:protein mono-ADP-ribosyltransferase PARP14-like isoform X2 [Hemiscyllium ocellatum]|uniref:protein mono-ADP-ribosyltransferase PARP14-like isoform X2 n=1 Tax=Hemiscyllium ocellatum TaxID=170820 RepID=UPI002966D198|nr:protein mono-ADP-ribosyltransferase PARP14-like isoform X2 [Hemiscyllium ocellatum]